MKMETWLKSILFYLASPHRYFHLKKLKTWTLAEEKLLIEGIQKYGVGEWERIRRDFLSDWVYNRLPKWLLIS